MPRPYYQGWAYTGKRGTALQWRGKKIAMAARSGAYALPFENVAATKGYYRGSAIHRKRLEHEFLNQLDPEVVQHWRSMRMRDKYNFLKKFGALKAWNKAHKGMRGMRVYDEYRTVSAVPSEKQIAARQRFAALYGRKGSFLPAPPPPRIPLRIKRAPPAGEPPLFSRLPAPPAQPMPMAEGPIRIKIARSRRGSGSLGSRGSGGRLTKSRPATGQ